MALINKINSLNEKIISNESILNISKDILREKANKKIVKESNKLNKILLAYELPLANIDLEVNKRLPKLMLKYNKKDYWKRREVIQQMRIGRLNKVSGSYDLFIEKINELNELKFAYENEVKNKLYEKLSKVIILENDKRLELQEELAIIKNDINSKIEQLIKLENEKCNQKCLQLELKYNNKKIKLKNRIDELQARLVSSNSNDLNNYKLDDNVLLKVDHLTMQFGGLKAVDDLSFEVKKGEVFGLIGPNGAGKTTVFNCITQFYQPTKGNIYFADGSGATVLMNNIKVHNVVKKGIIRTFQNVEVIKEISVLDNLLVAAHSQYKSSLFHQFLHLPRLKKEELAIRKKADEVLEFMGLSLYKNWYAFGLPYGVLKKIEIARTLMNNPKLIILDEPAAGLNDTETAELTQLIRKIQEKYECTILLVEHDMGLVMDICDTVCAISFGKLLAIGTTTEIQQNKDVQAAYLGVEEE